jgi:hypothetical protein
VCFIFEISERNVFVCLEKFKANYMCLSPGTRVPSETGDGLAWPGLIVEAVRSQSDTPHSAGILRTSDQTVTETYI